MNALIDTNVLLSAALRDYNGRTNFVLYEVQPTMVSITRDVNDLAANERAFYERVLGQKLRGEQQVTVQLLDANVGAQHSTCEGPWTDAKNARRAELIDKEIAGTLSSSDAGELAKLQQAMLDYRRAIAPLPLDDVQNLHNELLRIHGQNSTG